MGSKPLLMLLSGITLPLEMEACNNIVDRIAKDMHNFRNEISAVMHSVSPHCIVLWREDSSFPLET